MASDVSAPDASFRAKLGFWLVFGSSMGVIVLSMVVIWAAAGLPGVGQPHGVNAAETAKQVRESAQLIFTAVLPLLGTWVGTVLAFYYTKDSLEAASRTTLETVRSVSQRLASMPVNVTMMPTSKIVQVKLSSGQALGSLTLKAIGSLFNTTIPTGQKISRLLIVNDGGACVGIIHRSVWMEMQFAGTKLSPAAADSDPLSKLLSEKNETGKTFNDVLTGTLAYVAIDRTLADAKAAMSALPMCQDVIVTQTGKSSEAMLGWISNVDLAQQSQA